MTKSVIYKVYLCCLLLNSYSLAFSNQTIDSPPIPKNQVTTAVSVGQTVAENAFIYRKVIEITNDQHYKVQNFYKNTHHKQSDILTIKDPSKLTTFQELQTYNLKNLMFDGDLTLWFDNGNKSMSVNINQGNANGPFNTYYITGDKEIEGYYHAGKPDGLWKYWTQTGKLDKQVYYQQGIIQWQKSSIQIQGF